MARGAVDDRRLGRVNEEVVGSKEIITQNGKGNGGEDKGKSEMKGTNF